MVNPSQLLCEAYLALNLSRFSCSCSKKVDNWQENLDLEYSLEREDGFFELILKMTFLIAYMLLIAFFLEYSLGKLLDEYGRPDSFSETQRLVLIRKCPSHLLECCKSATAVEGKGCLFFFIKRTQYKML